MNGNLCKGDCTCECECENARECEFESTVNLHMYINVSASLSVSVSASVSVGVSISKKRHNFITVQYYQSHSRFANKIKIVCNNIHCKNRKVIFSQEKIIKPGKQ